jgi:hypothetical protein
MFALALTLVVIFSSIVLLWQYYTGDLVSDEGSGAAPAEMPAHRDDALPLRPHIDRAA